MIHANRYALPLRTPYRWAKGTQWVRRGALVHVEQGWGEIAPPPHEDIDFLEMLGRITQGKPRTPREACGLREARADDCARADGVPLATWLGESLERKAKGSVPVNALLTAGPIEDLLTDAQALWSQGYRTFKLKCGRAGDDDVARLAALRDRLGASAIIRMDANEGWGEDEAKQILDAASAYDVQYVEQPLPFGHASMSSLERFVPVALDEEVTGADVMEDLASRASFVILKPQRLGGPQPTLDAIMAAEDAGLVPIVTNSLETSIGVHHALALASLLAHDHACGLATSRWLARDVAPTPFIDAQAHMHLPTGPGLGVQP